MAGFEGGKNGSGGDGYNSYYYKNSGINKKGNHYCARDYGPSAPNQNAYHYSNRNGSYYYSNPDGSKYYNSGHGSAWYGPPPSSTMSPNQSMAFSNNDYSNQKDASYEHDYPNQNASSSCYSNLPSQDSYTYEKNAYYDYSNQSGSYSYENDAYYDYSNQSGSYSYENDAYYDFSNQSGSYSFSNSNPDTSTIYSNHSGGSTFYSLTRPSNK